MWYSVWVLLVMKLHNVRMLMVVLGRTIGTALFVQIGESCNRKYSSGSVVDPFHRTRTHPSKRLIYGSKISWLME